MLTKSAVFDPDAQWRTWCTNRQWADIIIATAGEKLVTAVKNNSEKCAQFNFFLPSKAALSFCNKKLIVVCH